LSDDLTDILDPAYATYPGNRAKPGVICLAVVPYVVKRLYTMQPLDPDPKSASHRRFELIEKTPQTLASREQDKWQLPYKDLNLDVDEDLLIVKVKRRPVVVLSRAIVDEQKADPSRIQDSFWCIPEYTLIDQFFHPQFDQDFIEDVTALTYRSFFPLPYDPHFHDRQAMLRLDRMQPVPRHLLKPTERRLAKKWLLYLYEWARFYITGTIGDDDTDKNPNSIASTLKAARDAMMGEVAKNRAKQESTNEN